MAKAWEEERKVRKHDWFRRNSHYDWERNEDGGDGGKTAGNRAGREVVVRFFFVYVRANMEDPQWVLGNVR